MFIYIKIISNSKGTELCLFWDYNPEEQLNSNDNKLYKDIVDNQINQFLNTVFKYNIRNQYQNILNQFIHIYHLKI